MTSRRDFLRLAGVTPLLLLGVAESARGEVAAACFNPDALPTNQKSMRRSLGFSAVSPDPKKACGSCAFFSGAANGCGKCQLLSGGAVAAVSNCRSWAKKA